MRQPRSRALAVLALLLAASAVLPAGPVGAAEGPLERNAGEGAQAREAVLRYVTLWRIEGYERMYDLLAARDRARYTEAGFVALHQRFAEAVEVSSLDVAVGSPVPIARPPEPRPPDRPPPASSEPPMAPAGDPVAGPVPALAVPVRLTFHTALLGDLVLDRRIELTAGLSGWDVRWIPGLLFPELGTTVGSFRLERGSLPVRGRILAADGTVLAMTRSDGKRVYPQDTLAGQTIGYATPLTDAEANARPPAGGYAAGQLVGRRGVEAGAESLLRGRAAATLLVVSPGGEESAVFERPEVQSANVRLTIQPYLQRAAESAIGGRPEAATAVVDPASGDIWALASSPAFNPNAMTLGTTSAGSPLAKPTAAQMRNNAVESAYPTGSSFKPFTLAAALQTGVAGPATRMSCAPTWDDLGFTFRNYMNHSLPGRVSLVEAMAFSCNTTYMPLSMVVYNHDRRALTDLIADFGFGQPTGVGWIAETAGVLPDALWFEGHRRANGNFRPFGPFDQVQLAIGQGSFLGTQLQLALAYAAFANRGTLWEPRLVTGATAPDGTVVMATRPTVHRRIAMTRAQIDYLVTALVAVTTYSYGTATAAFRGFGIPVAGKSGTAESGGPDPHALFPAFAPAADPRIVVATILARVHLGTGGSDSAPLVRRVMAAFFNH